MAKLNFYKNFAVKTIGDEPACDPAVFISFIFDDDGKGELLFGGVKRNELLRPVPERKRVVSKIDGVREPFRRANYLGLYIQFISAYSNSVDRLAVNRALSDVVRICQIYRSVFRFDLK